MKRTKRRWLVLIGTAVTAVLVGGVLLVMVVGRVPPAPPLPNPNGYEDFLKAGNSITKQAGDWRDLDHDSLRVLVMTNAEALQLLRLGLTRRSAVPTDATIKNFGAISGDLMALKSVATLLAAEGRLAEMERRPADAARSYTDAIRLGSEMSRGGLIINRLVGIACEGIGSVAFVKIVPQLPCEQAGPLAKELEQIDAAAVTWEEIARNENRFVRAQLATYRNPIKLVSDYWVGRASNKAARGRHDLAAARLRLLITELALRCYRGDQGTAPLRLEEMVPKYLARIPADPFGRGQMVY